MKKNRMMRLASVLLVCVLLTTSVISGTFAKYTTTANASDTARVAKWGVVITSGGSLFGENYKTGTESVPTTEVTASLLSVKNGDTTEGAIKDLVAPGTKSENGLSFSINGKPEVRTKVDVTVEAQDIYLAAGTYAVMQSVTVTETTFAEKRAAGIYTENSGAYTKVAADAVFAVDTKYYELSGEVEVAEVGYYPVQYANSNTDSAFTGKTKVTEIAEAIARKIGTSSDAETTPAKVSYTVTNTYDPNTDLATTLKLNDNTISWAWTFEVDDNTNKMDTILGDLMAGTTVVAVDGDTVAVLTVEDGIVKNNATEVGSLVTSFNISISATQVD